jgi:hypothetical protein
MIDQMMTEGGMYTVYCTTLHCRNISYDMI